MNSYNTKIKVATDILVSRAGDATQKINAMDNRLKEIAQVVKGTRSYWIGDAGDTCRNQYESEQAQINELIERLKKQPKTLLSIAGVYVDTEREAVNVSTPLPDNVID